MLKLVKTLTKTSNFKVQGLIRKMPCYRFSIKESKTSLQEILKKEHEEETQQEREVSDFTEKFLQDTDWKLDQSEQSTKMTLKRQTQGYNVSVVYQARLVNQDDEQDMQDPENPDEQESPSEANNILEFMVLVDNGTKNQLVVDMITMDGSMNVNNVFVTNEGEKYLNDKTHTFTTNEYTGPIFETLDENLQDKFLGLLNSLGINEDLALFIESTSQDHEETLYLNWLDRFAKFLDQLIQQIIFFIQGDKFINILLYNQLLQIL